MKCPFCNAELAENSRFCLFCMKSLEEKEIIEAPKKKKWWLTILTAILLSLLICCGIWLLSVNNDSKSSGNSNHNITENNEEPSDENLVTNEQDTKIEANDYEPCTTENVSEKVENVYTTDRKDTSLSNKLEESTTDSGKTNKDDITTPNKIFSDEKSTNTTASTTTTTAPTTTESSVETEKIENVTWYYRSAFSNEYDKRYNQVETEDAITIIGFKNITSNGIYKIPESIDGKTVVAINMSNPQGYSFNDNAVNNIVKKVYLPPKLNKIWAKTFSECINLTDLYISSDYLYADPSVFSTKSERTKKLTIHTSDNCWCLYGSKNFSIYCSPYGANEYYAAWEEWNGDIYN